MSEPLFTETRACPLCHSDQFSVVHTPEQTDSHLSPEAFRSRKKPQRLYARYLRCQPCEICYASPAFPPQRALTAYAAAPQTTALSKSANDNYAAFLKRTAFGYMETAPDNVLEIGGGSGDLLNPLLELGFCHLTVCEPGPSVERPQTTPRKTLIKQPFEAASFDDESFSLILAFQVLEHVPCPTDFIEKVYALLRPGGLFISVLHNAKSVGHRLLRTRSPLYDLQHYQLFSRLSLRTLLAQGSLEVRYLKPFWNSYPLYYWMRLLSISVPPSPWNRRQLRIPAGNLAVVAIKH